MNRATLFRTSAWQLALTAIICVSSPGAEAQTPAQSPRTVQWHVAVASARTVEPGQRSIIELTGQILEGWHVASPASGEFNEQLKKEFTSKIEQLLAEKAPAATATASASPAGTVAGSG